MLRLDIILVADARVGSATIRVRRLIVAARRRLRDGCSVGTAAALRVLMIFIEIVTLKQLLRRRIHDNIHVFFNCLRIFPLLVIYVILVEINLIWARQVRRPQTTINEAAPVEVFEPGVALGLVVAIIAESIFGLPAEALVDEVGGLEAPAVGHARLTDLLLLAQNVVAYFSPRLAHVGSTAKHALPRNDADGEVVGRDSVIVLAHDLGRHVTRRPARLIRIVHVLDPFARDTEVR